MLSPRGQPYGRISAATAAGGARELIVVSACDNPEGRALMGSYGIRERDQMVDVGIVTTWPARDEFSQCCGDSGFYLEAIVGDPRVDDLLRHACRATVRARNLAAERGGKPAIACFCPHAKHRSVALVELLGHGLRSMGWSVGTAHLSGAWQTSRCRCKHRAGWKWPAECPLVKEACGRRGPGDTSPWLHQEQVRRYHTSLTLLLPMLQRAWDDVIAENDSGDEDWTNHSNP